MSRYDNPFDTGNASNPFSDTPAGRGRPTAPPAKEAVGGSYFDSTPGGTVSIGDTEEIPLGNVNANAKEIKKKEQELRNLEAALKKREEDLRRREQTLGIEHKNWPPLLPILHHDIANDIPAHLQATQRAAYWSWLGIMWCLFFNVICTLAAWADSAVYPTRGLANFILALLYALCGFPLSYFLWYKRLYTAMRKDGAISFGIFFVFYLVHIAFCVFASIAPPFLFRGLSIAGVYAAIEFFADGWTTIGIMYSIGAGFFICESLLSIYVLQRVYFFFRGAGKARQMRGEVAMNAMGY